MYIKFLKHGQGSPSKAAAYLVDEKDHLNVIRSDVQILVGDPQTFAAIAESIKNDWKYTSGVIAWSKNDDPSDEQVKEVLKAFEKHAFAGLEPNQYHFTAVLHREDDGSKHVHFLVPRIELESGKALNIAPPGHAKYFDPLRDYFNYKNNWDKPDSIALQRDTQQPDYVHFQAAAAVRAGLKGKTANDIHEVVGSYIEQRVEHGFIRSRKDVLDAVSELGEVTRMGEKFISLKLDGAEKAVRLKGAFYESEFSIESYFENRARTANDARASRENGGLSAHDKKRANECKTELERVAAKRSEYNEQRYTKLETSDAAIKFDQLRQRQNSTFDQSADQSSTNKHRTATATNAATDRQFRELERHEQRDSKSEQNQKKSNQLEYHFVSVSSDFFSHLYLSGLRQQEHIQRNASKRSSFEANRSSDRAENTGIQQRDAGYIESQSTREQIDDTRSAIIANYRTAAASAGERIRAIRAANADNHPPAELQRQISAAGAAIERSKQRVKQYHQEIAEPSTFRNRIEHAGERFTAAITEPFRKISRWIADRQPSENLVSRKFTTTGTAGNRYTDSAFSFADFERERQNQGLSAKSVRINTNVIFKALEILDQRTVQQKTVIKNTDRGMDFDM